MCGTGGNEGSAKGRDCGMWKKEKEEERDRDKVLEEDWKLCVRGECFEGSEKRAEYLEMVGVSEEK